MSLMIFDLGSQNLLITIALVAMTLALALLGCLLLGGKAQRARTSAAALMFLEIIPLYLVTTFVALNYYGLLFADALFDLVMLVCCLITVCSSWMEWLSPPPQWKTRSYREQSIFSGVCLTIAGIVLAFFTLPPAISIISDMARGPSFETGVVEQLTLRQTGGAVAGGDFVVQGVSYFTADLPWYHTLSIGHSVRFAYGPTSHYGFPADQMILNPLGMAFPVLVFGFILLVFSAGYHILRPSGQSTGQSHSEERNQFEQIIDSVAEYRETKGAGFLILLMIVPLLFLGLFLLILISK